MSGSLAISSITLASVSTIHGSQSWLSLLLCMARAYLIIWKFSHSGLYLYAWRPVWISTFTKDKISIQSIPKKIWKVSSVLCFKPSGQLKDLLILVYDHQRNIGEGDSFIWAALLVTQEFKAILFTITVHK